MSAQRCDCSEQLVAWLDGELAIGEAAYVEEHLAGCVECRAKVDAYRKVSAGVRAVWDAAGTRGTQRVATLRVLPFVGAAAAAAILGFFLLRAHRPPLEPAVQPAPAIASAVTIPDAVPDAPPAPPASIPAPASIPLRASHASPASPPVRVARVRHSAERSQSLQAKSLESNWAPAEPAVEIAIPAEALFPAGAMPQGVGFVADLSLAADGTPQRLHLEPQLIQFERSR